MKLVKYGSKCPCGKKHNDIPITAGWARCIICDDHKGKSTDTDIKCGGEPIGQSRKESKREKDSARGKKSRD